MQRPSNSRMDLNAGIINARNPKGATIMNAKNLMRSSLFAALSLSFTLTAAAPASAAETRTGGITDNCTANCVDTWKVDCKNGATHEVRARVKDHVLGNVILRITNTGYVGPKALIGQADAEIASTFNTYSSFAQVTRPGATHGATKTMVLITADEATSYTVEFVCVDSGGIDVGDPVVTPLQD